MSGAKFTGCEKCGYDKLVLTQSTDVGTVVVSFSCSNCGHIMRFGKIGKSA